MLNSEEINSKLKAYQGWEYKNNQLIKTYRMSDFISALQFVNKIAIIAESMQHHPDIFIHYNQVQLCLSSHSENSVTQKDFDLLKEIEKQAVESI